MMFNPQSSAFNLQFRAGEPRYVRRFDELLLDGDGFSDRFNRDRFNRDRFDSVITAPPPKTPAQIAQELAGGLTPAQIDQLAKFQTKEGPPLVFAYGENMVGGTMASHKYTIGPPKKNEFTVALGDGEWEGPVTVWYKGEALGQLVSSSFYVDDLPLPAGATINNDNEGWNWITRDPKPYSGKFAHQSQNLAGHHLHSFTNATQTFPITSTAQLFCWIWIDPVNTPTEIMLQWQDNSGSFEHRAYWGADQIALGTNGTASRFQVSASIPATGQWVRLAVGSSSVGLNGQTIKGMGFSLFGGRATWDLAGQWDFNLSAAGYVFRHGIIATDGNDMRQLFDVAIPAGLSYNGAANIFVRLTEAQSAEDRPDGFKGRFKCRRTFDFDATGQEIGYGYSTNPARVAADRVLHFFQRIFRDRLDIAQEKFRARINWPSWVRWRDVCAALIPWNKDGTGNIFIPRFEAHIFFAQETLLADALDQITGLSATFWQDDGEQLIFVPPGEQIPIHHFNESNITGPPQITPVDLRQRPNRLIARFREIDDIHLGPAVTEPPDNTPEALARQSSIDRVGEIRSEREFPNMRQSQAQRTLEYRARLEHDNPILITLVGDGTSVHVLPGDFVTVTHPLPKWDHQLCLVVDITVRSGEESADEVEFTLQQINGPLYSDTAHGPIQPAITLP